MLLHICSVRNDFKAQHLQACSYTRSHMAAQSSWTFAGPAGQKELYLTAEALSEAALISPAIYDTLSGAYVQAVLGQLTINTPASIQVATAALAGLRSAQQPQMVQV